jgi:CDP-paratose 2-epimerase
MKILITGICGFVGFRIARHWLEAEPSVEIIGMDNFIRPGSETHRSALRKLGIKCYHGDIRCRSDFDSLPAVDWVIDCAANPSVLAGIDGQSSSRQLMEHNLSGSLELLEYCRRCKAGFILLSTSRVYGVKGLSELPMRVEGSRFVPDAPALQFPGMSERGINEQFSTEPPLSLYGVSKRAAELLALEYGATFDFPVWINRCGVMAGPGQFGKADQGIVSFWIHAFRSRKPLKYIGFGGNGYQVRDFFDPKDLVPLLQKQSAHRGQDIPRTLNFGGGNAISLSLAELTLWCQERFGPHEVQHSTEVRPFDIPWVIMDDSRARHHWGWSPVTGKLAILESIAQHAESHPEWLELAS